MSNRFTKQDITNQIKVFFDGGNDFTGQIEATAEAISDHVEWLIATELNHERHNNSNPQIIVTNQIQKLDTNKLVNELTPVVAETMDNQTLGAIVRATIEALKEHDSND